MSVTGKATVTVGVLATIAGIAVLAVGRGSAAEIVGAALLGLAGIAFTGLAFLLVGESEDRERMRRRQG